jgi:hypothetical protein
MHMKGASYTLAVVSLGQPIILYPGKSKSTPLGFIPLRTTWAKKKPCSLTGLSVL